MSRLKKMDKYAILWLDSQGFSLEEIMKETELSENVIKSCLEKHQTTNKNNNIETSTSPASKPKKNNLMINETAVKKNKTVMIMTQEQSMKNDAEKKNNNMNKPSSKIKNSIFRPNK
jgi:hypothetical protein